jgi:cell division initiation protein
MSDLDLPLLPSAEQIRRRQFATVRRGYDPDQVHDYLNQVALQVEALEGELREQRLTPGRVAEEVPAAPIPEAASVAEPMPAPMVATEGMDTEAAYDRISKRLASVLRAADEEAQKLIEQARTESAKLLDEARAEADRIRVDAQAKAEEARTMSSTELQRAKAEADRVLGGLEQRRESLLGQMHEMQSRLLAVAQNLEIPEAEPAGPVDTGAHIPTGPVDTGTHIAQDPEPVTPSTDGSGEDGEPAMDSISVTEGGAPANTEPAPVKVGKPARDDDAVDPRYEDMWGAPRPIDMPDLSTLDVDFDEDSE